MDHAQTEFIAYMEAALEKRGFVRDPLFKKFFAIEAEPVLKFLRNGKTVYLRIYAKNSICALDERYENRYINSIYGRTFHAWQKDRLLLTMLENL